MFYKEPGRLSILVTDVFTTEQLASSFAETGSGADEVYISSLTEH